MKTYYVSPEVETYPYESVSLLCSSPVGDGVDSPIYNDDNIDWN